LDLGVTEILSIFSSLIRQLTELTQNRPHAFENVGPNAEI